MKTAINEAMVKVLAIGRVNRLSTPCPPYNCHKGVGYRNKEQRDYWKHCNRGLTGVSRPADAHQRQDCQNVAHAEGASIAHKNARRWKVEEKKPCEAACKGKCENCRDEKSLAETDESHEKHCNQGYTPGKAVRAIYEVHGICEGYDPEDGEGNSCHRRDRHHTEEWQVYHTGVYATSYRHCGGDDLNHELEGGAKIDKVIIQPEKMDDRQPDEYEQEGMLSPEPCPVSRKQENQSRYRSAGKRENYSRPAQARGVFTVNFAVIDFIIPVESVG